MELAIGLNRLLDRPSQQVGLLVRQFCPYRQQGDPHRLRHAHPQLLDMSPGLACAQIGSTVSRPVVVAVAMAWLQRSRW